MNNVFLVTEATNELKEKAITTVTQVLNPKILIIGIILIIVAVITLVFLKNIILNSILGALGFLICYFLFGIKLPLFATIVVSAVFGPAGLGTMLILRFFGIA